MDRDEVVREALQTLDAHLLLSEQEGPTTHIAIGALDFEHEDVAPALGRYIVGVLMGAIEDDASLSQDLLDVSPDEAAEVRSHVEKLIRTSNDFSDDSAKHFRDHTRNPFITEVLAHALLVLRKTRATACVAGPTVALKQPHPDPRRQGIDLVAIYNDGGAAVPVIGEAKSSKANGSAQLSKSAEFFASLDAGERGYEVRTELRALGRALSDELREGFAPRLWRDRCCYLPVIVHGQSLDVLADLDGLASLKPPQDHIRVVGLEVEGFHRFFDDVADEILLAVEELLA
jgi:hypothetical protein